DIFIYRKSTLMGFIGIIDGGYIAGLFVDEKFQSQGIGKKLLEHCKQIYPCLSLDVFVKNTGAVRFYQNNGFEIVDTKTNPEFKHTEHHMVWNAPASDLTKR
ncbi:GNAT family N-acetyltransferase, partial [Eubacteriales bacterium OttesenSCG-928-K08]|nr:GNAT family N-acetyltransferase [Eubacteriales bacterium OttesenSCG-928-K08]